MNKKKRKRRKRSSRSRKKKTSAFDLAQNPSRFLLWSVSQLLLVKAVQWRAKRPRRRRSRLRRRLPRACEKCRDQSDNTVVESARAALRRAVFIHSPSSL
ncbi:hypothetical protein R5R35_012436 [Gryllus longicercus]|uniref:Uncharacterized protein n=1 Tax=Gryllus longicercus TaxID=2509291 RepID=A0AAN9V044_9ORTH